MSLLLKGRSRKRRRPHHNTNIDNYEAPILRSKAQSFRKIKHEHFMAPKILRRISGTSYYKVWRPSISYFGTTFKISKPKPWRKDDKVAVRANKEAEIPADPNDDTLEMKSNKNNKKTLKGKTAKRKV